MTPYQLGLARYIHYQVRQLGKDWLMSFDFKHPRRVWCWTPWRKRPEVKLIPNDDVDYGTETPEWEKWSE